MNIDYNELEKSNDYHSIFKKFLFYNGDESTPLKSLKDIDTFIRELFNIELTLKGNFMYNNPLMTLKYDFSDYIDPTHDNYIYSLSNYIFIFPDDGIRLVCTKNYINTIPVLRNIISDNWNDKPIKLSYIKDNNLNTIYTTSNLYILHLPLESLMYDDITNDHSGQLFNGLSIRTKYFNSKNILQTITKLINEPYDY
jgi:hypothetical protein